MDAAAGILPHVAEVVKGRSAAKRTGPFAARGKKLGCRRYSLKFVKIILSPLSCMLFS